MDSDIFRASITTYSVPSLHAFFPLFRTHPQFSTISARVCVRFRFLAMTKKYARHSLDVFFHYCGFNPRPRMYARPFATPDCYRARTHSYRSVTLTLSVVVECVVPAAVANLDDANAVGLDVEIWKFLFLIFLMMM